MLFSFPMDVVLFQFFFFKWILTNGLNIFESPLSVADLLGLFCSIADVSGLFCPVAHCLSCLVYFVLLLIVSVRFNLSYR